MCCNYFIIFYSVIDVKFVNVYFYLPNTYILFCPWFNINRYMS